MRGKKPIDIVDDAGLRHRQRTPTAFLGRLEQKTYRSSPFGIGARQPLRDPQSDRGMAVVPAGMMDAGTLRPEPLARRTVSGLRRLRDRKRIDIETEPDHRPVTAFELSDHCGHSSRHATKPLGCDRVIANLVETQIDGGAWRSSAHLFRRHRLRSDAEPETECVEAIGNATRGAHLGKAELGLAMEIAAERDPI